MTTNIDFDEPIDNEAELEEEEPTRKGNPLRIILLVLVVLVLLCLGCFLASRFLPISLPLPDLLGGGAQPTPAPPAMETPIPPPTEEQLPPGVAEATGEVQLPATEEPVEGQPPATEEPGEVQPPATEEPVEGQPPSQQPEGSPTATTTPVPGPTSTPGPTVIITIEPDCEQNVPPVADADGPYTAMMGKGQAFVTFDGSGSSDSDGTIVSYVWDFGDNSAAGSGETVTHGYATTGSFEARLTVTDNCGATSEDTAAVTVTGPTPPATGTITPTVTMTATPTGTPATPPPSEAATFGFCHLVQYRQTLSGIAAYYGVPWSDLAEVNGVSMEYFVIAGQGLFIPLHEPQPGPNVYEVLPGDTWGSIAGECGLSRQILADANGLDVNVDLMPGDQLVIPRWRDVYP
ncbi:MAG: PKD domain-containing protein [Chloroflexota bacterium]